jgi:hypothetical protein
VSQFDCGGQGNVCFKAIKTPNPHGCVPKTGSFSIARRLMSMSCEPVKAILAGDQYSDFSLRVIVNSAFAQPNPFSKLIKFLSSCCRTGGSL